MPEQLGDVLLKRGLRSSACAEELAGDGHVCLWKGPSWLGKVSVLAKAVSAQKPI